jgi:4-hydroxy-tetrahydrodipicolinate synthase
MTSRTRPALRGALTALVTPFTADGTFDEATFRQLVRWQLLAGIDGLVPCGTTGEAPTLTADERERVIAATVEVASERPSRDRVRIVAGTGTNDTAATIAATRRAAALGADAALVVAPYYNRPDGRMLEAHFRAVADEGDLPIVVYNVPIADGHERRRRHVPAAGRTSAGHRDQGGQRQPRADRHDLSRTTSRRRRVGRRRCVDPAGAGHGW